MAAGAPRAAGYLVRAPRRGSAPSELPAGAAPVRAELPVAAGTGQALAAEAARLPARPRDRRRWPPSLWRRLPAAREAALCARAVPAGRRGRGPGRGRRRVVRQGEPLEDVLPPRPAGAALSEEPERSLPSGALPAVARERRQGETRASTGARGRAEDGPGRRGAALS